MRSETEVGTDSGPRAQGTISGLGLIWQGSAHVLGWSVALLSIGAQHRAELLRGPWAGGG